MIPILLTTTNERQPDCVVAWDPLGGNPVATLSGEMAHRCSLVGYSDGVVCAAAKKPYIQAWNFQSSTCTGCLVGVLDGCHSAQIGEMKLTPPYHQTPTVLVTADVSGFIACWSLTKLMDELSLLSATSSEEATIEKDSSAPTRTQGKLAPLWYAVQASRSLPRVSFVQSGIMISGSEGLKLFDPLNGDILGTALCDISGGLTSCCPMPPNDTRVFSGGLNGLLYSTDLTQSRLELTSDREVRRCFVSSTLNAQQKAITELLMTPCHPNLLIVGSRGGLIEVLRTDKLLTCLQQFSILNPTLASTDSAQTFQLTGLCLIARPDWLSSMGTSSNATASVTNSQRGHVSAGDSIEDESHMKASCGLEPLKRHFGWSLDDTVRMRLPDDSERMNPCSHDANIYLDDFHTPGEQLELGESAKTQPDNALEAQVEKLTAVNRQLLRRLVDYEILK